jgi:hypothetical protein
MCRKCGKQGHKASKCRVKIPSDGEGFIQCTYCKKRGHKEAECRKKQRDESSNDTKHHEPCSQNDGGKSSSKPKGKLADVVFVALCEFTNKYLLNITSKGSYFFLCDSGATFHMTYVKSKLINVSKV